MSAARRALDSTSSGGVDRASRDESRSAAPPARRSSLASVVRSRLRRGSRSEVTPEERRGVRRESRSEPRAAPRTGQTARESGEWGEELVTEKTKLGVSRKSTKGDVSSKSTTKSRSEARAVPRCEIRKASSLDAYSGNRLGYQSQTSLNSEPANFSERQTAAKSADHSDSRAEQSESPPAIRIESGSGSPSELRPEIRISCVGAASDHRASVRRRKTGVHRRRGRLDMASRPGPLDLTRATTSAASTSGAAALSADSDPDIAFFQQRLGGTAPRVVGATLKRPESTSAGPRSPGVRSPPWASHSRASVFEFGDDTQSGVASPSPGPSPGPDTVSASFFFEPDDDPQAALRSERDFIEYVLSLPSSDLGSERLRPPGGSGQLRKSATAGGSSKVGLEHLDHLCKLMEQLGDLREQNSLLQRRIQYLEELKGLQEAQWTMGSGPNPSGVSPSQRHGSEESLLKSRGGDAPTKGKRNLKLKRALYVQQRERSKSVGHDTPEAIPDAPIPQPTPPRPARTTVASLPPPIPPRRGNELGVGKAKISKWTKVKEAFRWEKAQEIREDSAGPGESAARTRHAESAPVAPLPESKSQDSGLEVDRSRLLQIPGGSRSRDSYLSPSPVDSMLSGGSTGLTPNTAVSSMSSSTASSSEDLTEPDFVRMAREQDDMELPKNASLSLLETWRPDETSKTKSLDRELLRVHDKTKDKKDRSTWGRVRAIVQPRKYSAKKKSGRGGGIGGASGNVTDGAVSDGATLETPSGDFEGYESYTSVADEEDESRRLRRAGSWRRRSQDASLEQSRRHSRDESHPASGEVSRHVSRDESRESRPAEVTQSTREDPQLEASRQTSREEGRLSPPDVSRQVSREETSRQSSREESHEGSVGQHQRSASAGTRPTYESQTSSLGRESNWSKVKKAFLTGPATRKDLQRTGHELPEIDCPASESEAGRSREAPARLSASPDSPSSPTDHGVTGGATVADHVTELQKNLSEDFSKKMQEWERKRSGGPCRVAEEHEARPERRSRKEEVERQRKVTQVQHEEQLPAEFRRRLHEWERKQREGSGRRKRTEDGGHPEVRRKLTDQPEVRRKCTDQPDVRRKCTDGERRRGKHESREHGRQHATTPQAVEEDHLPAEFRKRLTEWEIAKALAGKSQQNVEQLQKHLPSEFNKKYEEWRLKMKMAEVKAGHGAPSQGQVSPGSQKRRAAELRRQTRTKDLQWLERELQKVEREKTRLEREREKYLDREARLERVRDAMRRPKEDKEDKVTIKTAEGEFRFEGINKNFTKKLYEWEERRGIPPDSESSTIALLAPNYRPHELAEQDAGRMVRCKSEGSLAELTSSALGQHSRQSSEDKTAGGLDGTLGDSTKACSEPDLRSDAADRPPTDRSADCGACAVLVDVEEVVAAPLEDIPPVQAQEPVYSYAPDEVTRLIDSSGSDSELPGRYRPREDLLVTYEVPEIAAGHDPQQAGGSYSGLLDVNISILDKLKQKEDVCRCLEEKLEEIGQNMIQIQEEHRQELEKLRNEKTKKTQTKEGDGLKAEEELVENNLQMLENLQQRCNELQGTGARLQEEREQIQASLQHHSDQQADLARHLVGNMRKLHAAGSSIDVASEQAHDTKDAPEEASATTEALQVDAAEGLLLPSPGARRKQIDKKTVDKLQAISTDLLSQAKRLEKALGPRQGKRPTRSYSQGHHSRSWSRNTETPPDWLRGDDKPAWQAADWSTLPSQLSKKVEELQREMLLLCTARASPHSPPLSMSPPMEELGEGDDFNPEEPISFTFHLPSQQKNRQETDEDRDQLSHECGVSEPTSTADDLCPTSPDEEMLASQCSSSRSSVEDLGAVAKWRNKRDLYTSYDQTLKEMQRELESVEAQYALDRRRKSSDDVISTPSSYRSRSSSIPSSEDVDEPKLFQMAEHPEHFIEEEEDDGNATDSRSEHGAEWDSTDSQGPRVSQALSSASEDRLFTAGATRTFEIPTVDTRYLSSLPPATSAPVIVSAQRTVYSVDHGKLQVHVRDQVDTPSTSTPRGVNVTSRESANEPSRSPTQREGVNLSSRESENAPPQLTVQREGAHVTSREGMSLSLHPVDEVADRLSSTTPTPTASPLPLRLEVTSNERPPLQASLSVTSQESTPSVEGSEEDVAKGGAEVPLVLEPVAAAVAARATGDAGDGGERKAGAAGDEAATHNDSEAKTGPSKILSDRDEASTHNVTTIQKVDNGSGYVESQIPGRVNMASQGGTIRPEPDQVEQEAKTTEEAECDKVKVHVQSSHDVDVAQSEANRMLKTEPEIYRSESVKGPNTPQDISPSESVATQLKSEDPLKKDDSKALHPVIKSTTELHVPDVEAKTTTATEEHHHHYTPQPSEQSKRSVLTLAGSSQNIRGMIEKFNNISDSPETSTPVLPRRDIHRPHADTSNVALQLQKSLSDGLVMLSSRDDNDEDEAHHDSNLIAQARSASGGAVLQPEPPSGSPGGLSPSLAVRGAEPRGLAGRPPRWSPLPPISSQVPHLTSSPVSLRTRVSSGGHPVTPSTPSSAPISPGATSPFPPFSHCVTSSVTSLSVTTPTGVDSSLDSSFDSAFEAARFGSEGRSPTPTARAERLRRARDQFFGATWSSRPSASGGEADADSAGGPFPFGAESPQRPPRRRTGSRAAGLAHSKSTGTINEASVRHSDISCGSDFSDVSVEEARLDAPPSARVEAPSGSAASIPPISPAPVAPPSTSKSAGSRVAHFLRLRHAKKRKGSAIGALIRQSMAVNAGQVMPGAEEGGAAAAVVPAAVGSQAETGAVGHEAEVAGAAAAAPPAPVRSCPSTPVTERASRSEARQRPGWRARKLFRSPTPPGGR
ncbi:uncharacterized protein LOC122375160 isoform X2 [Amphibalanus amphitrite]|uniref:uncharacterized protein LOC122375160 isoform X2 n=1 Tax=Amphibalanus amphitrite TaxID=1232801 RepID=UPI001C8FFA7E|nr:uncharacterized protein LOC122375160 isoform X2 [Amphibalanus amphitrite]